MELILAADLLSPSIGVIFWTALAFLILLALLSKFAWKPITGALEEREKTIEESITRAERALAEAKRLQSDTDAKRREAADKLRAEDLDKTKAEVTRLQQQAHADIERQRLQAMADLRQEVA
ncbi:MAG TPA: hypothetical protein VK610_04780, partial [Rhodothermales bacterium]|nr:hypothetical protein [Rhodothermales bacterium]